ncbi:hypothetical protein SALBM311S_03556 [Streptomyces alboniger]
MSRDTREWAWEYSASRGNARLVLLSIADRIPDEQCVAWASLTSLMKRTNASRNAVRGALVALAESGELEVLDDLGGPQHSTVYRLPRAAAWLAKVAATRENDPGAYVEPLTDAVADRDRYWGQVDPAEAADDEYVEDEGAEAAASTVQVPRQAQTHALIAALRKAA